MLATLDTKDPLLPSRLLNAFKETIAMPWLARRIVGAVGISIVVPLVCSADGKEVWMGEVGG